MPYSLDVVKQIAQRHSVEGEPERMPPGGMVNEAFKVGDFVLRMVMEARFPECDTEAAREAAVMPVVKAAGIVAPEMIAHGEADDLAPRPYSIYEFVDGVTLGQSRRKPDEFESVYFEIGQQIAKLHRLNTPASVIHELRKEDTWDNAKQIMEALEFGAITAQDSEELDQWAAHLESMMDRTRPDIFTHNDVHSWNVMIKDDKLAAIIDWGDSTLGHPALDHAVMPIQAVLPILEGYMAGGFEVNDAFMARAFWTKLPIAMWELTHLEDELERDWWCWPVGGWAEMKDFLSQNFPALLS